MQIHSNQVTTVHLNYQRNLVSLSNLVNTLNVSVSTVISCLLFLPRFCPLILSFTVWKYKKPLFKNTGKKICIVVYNSVVSCRNIHEHIEAIGFAFKITLKQQQADKLDG